MTPKSKPSHPPPRLRDLPAPLPQRRGRRSPRRPRPHHPYDQRTTRTLHNRGKSRTPRSRGCCENPLCTGQPADVTDHGEPILEVDHLENRANWGRDHPSQMIALCPNCHATKTRGQTRAHLRNLLLTEAHSRHTTWTQQAHTKSKI
ncbi:HNH endonuclease [Actinomadura yumaensis]|uniref:HNH endonuclease n=1 Tax=Actinomadura yumaensis TaxID=111807 RepID=UPI003613DF8C